MDNFPDRAFDFFSPGNNNFWRWADGGEIIEWNSGETIVYRRELYDLLNLFKGIGLPPLEAILMVLDACKDNWQIDDFISKINELNGFESFSYIPFTPDKHYLRTLSPSQVQECLAIDTLIAVSRLPKEMRTGNYRTLVLLKLFEYTPAYLTPAEDARGNLYVFGGDIFTNWLNSQPIPKTHNRVIKSIEALSLFSSERRELEVLLRTGLEQLPEPAPLPQPDPIPSNDDLLTQLSQDPQTAGLARLTKRLIAALNIPPHTQGASDQPLGGVSDISNRGDFDRLLLSELANDNDTLSARLVNNEALYLRRETPPDPQVQERVILVDTSLRLWGMPRVFAVSAALGCALNNHQNAGISAFALGKELIGPNALATKEDVIHFLEQQSPVLHSGEALRAFFRQQPHSAQRAVFFITSEEVMADKNFSLIFAEQQQHLDYLLVLNRTGTLLFYKLVNGQRSLMSTSVFDLEELLFEPKKSAMLGALVGTLSEVAQSGKEITIQGTFLPVFPGRLKRHEVAHHENLVIAVLPSRRVWLWHNASKGAIEIVNKIEEGRYEFYFENDELKCIVVQTREHHFFAYLFSQNTLSLVVDLHQKNIKHARQWNIVPIHEIDGTVFSCGLGEGKLIIGIQAPSERSYRGYNFTTHFLDLHTNKLVPLAERKSIPQSNYLQSLTPIKKIINNGYSVLRNVREIGFTADGFIQLGSRHRIVLQNDKLWLIQASSSGVSMQKFESETWMDNQFYTRSTEWPNGCKVTLDSRGFLSFDSIRPYNNFEIILIIGQELTAFSTRDHCTGNPYFYTTSDHHNIVSPTHFYKRFILEFINAIGTP